MATEKKPSGGKSFEIDLALHDQRPDDELPDVAIYQLDRRGRVAKKLAVAQKGKVKIEEAWRDKGLNVAIGPDVGNLADLRNARLMKVRVADLWPQWTARGEIEIPRQHWTGWCWYQVCLSGEVRHCVPWILFPPPLLDPVPTLPFSQTPGLPPDYWPWMHCRRVCDGIVEVYARECCCDLPIIIDPDPWLENLCKRFPEICEPWPPIPWPPIPDPPIGPEPGPDPAPPYEPPLDPRAVRQMKLADSRIDRAVRQPVSQRLRQDLSALRQLKGPEAIKAFLLERPHLSLLWCHCHVKKVGETILNPDGSFNFCYWPFSSIRWPFTKCTTTYAFKVKQWIENQWVEIYDGVAAHEYFAADELAELVSHHLQARPCSDPEEPEVDHDKPFVMLERLGVTYTYRLNSPLQQSETGIGSAPLPANGGLADPLPPGVGDGLYDRPWGEILRFRLFVEEGMKALGARYYRISRVASDDDGNPVAGATPLPFNAPVAWRKIEYTGGWPAVTGESLGPTTVNGENSLYKIPYWDDANWLSGQYHQVWDTRADANGRHLIVVEIFDQNGNRLKPTGAAGTGTAKNFDYLHWQTSQALDVVPFAALVHVLWTDNNPVYGDIEKLRKNNSASGQECQFITGDADDDFAVEFRAFHLHGPAGNSFMWSWFLQWQRGLNGGWHLLDSGTQNVPATLYAGDAQVSASATFDTMLSGVAPPRKCAFSVRLRVRAKHTNGSRRLDEYDRWDHASFALEILSPAAAA